jgi:hypothetical protein
MTQSAAVLGFGKEAILRIGHYQLSGRLNFWSSISKHNRSIGQKEQLQCNDDIGYEREFEDCTA